MLVTVLERAILEKTFLRLVMSRPKKGGELVKLHARPLEKGFQITTFKGAQAFHANYPFEEFVSKIQELYPQFKQIQLYSTTQDYHFLYNKKGEEKLIKKPTEALKPTLQHNRPKNYLLSEDEPYEFLIALGIMNQEGRIHPHKRDKFIQIVKFLEHIEQILPSQSTLNVLDLGCGKGYLTFALYYYLTKIKNFEVKMTGVDLKREVLAECQKIADKLEYAIRFVPGSIEDYEPDGQMDLVIALHACNTATDRCLEKAIQAQAKALFVAPCCQYELLHKINSPLLKTLLSYPLLKERFAALATDALRAELLKASGYAVQIVEWTDFEHTPKNLAIRALLHPVESEQKRAQENTLAFKDLLGIK